VPSLPKLPLQADELLPASSLPGIEEFAWSPVVDNANDAFLFAAETGALSNKLYLTEAGDHAAISAMDIHQGQIGDCFLLSPIGEIAMFAPSKIQSMIHDNGNGTETVTLYIGTNGKSVGWGTTAFKSVQVTVDNAFAVNGVNHGATQDVVGNQKEIWAQVLEKADATLHGGYAAIAGGGYPVLAMEEITGHHASWASAAAVTEGLIRSHMAAGDMMTFDTYAKSGLSYGLVGSHCYMFQELVGSGSNAAVKLLNPWGFDEPAAVPVAQLAKVFAEVDFCPIA
jgi:hypothetical protein